MYCEATKLSAAQIPGTDTPGALNQRLTALRGKPVRLEISMIVNLSRIFIRLTLHNISMVIISLSCLIVKQAIEHRGLHPRLVKTATKVVT